MTSAVQHRKGTTAEHATFTGLEGEVTIDTTKDTAVIHDGSTVGGFPLAKENLANFSTSGLSTIDGASTASDDKFLIYDQSTTSLKTITRAELNNAMEQDALANVAITGGTIDGTTIGGTTPAAITGTTITANTSFAGALNGTVGATTPDSGAFTTLTTSSTVTHNGGTANGVAYLNGSKVLTTGSALTFDGTRLTVNTESSSEVDVARFQASNSGDIQFLDISADAVANFVAFDVTGSTGGDYIFRRGGSEQMRLTGTGLGIGTSSPNQKLEIAGASPTLNMASTNRTWWIAPVETGASDANLQIGTGSSRNTTYLTMTPFGNLGLGVTPSASERVLAKSATSDGTTSSYVAKNSSGTILLDIISTGYFKTGVAANSPYNNASGSGANMVVGSDGALFRSTSSLKYKTDVQDATFGIADVLKLRAVTYKGKGIFDGDKVFAGLIAEEVHDSGLTQFVQYADDGSPDALSYGNMVSLCIKAIQEQQAIIETLKARLDAAGL